MTDEQIRDRLIAWISETVGDRADRDSKNHLFAALTRFYAANEDGESVPTRTSRAVNTLLNRLARLSDGKVQVMLDMLEEATQKNWTSVWPSGTAKQGNHQDTTQGEENVEWL